MENATTLSQKVAIIHSFEPEPQSAVNILMKLQLASEEGYVDEASARLVADYLEMPESRIYELVSYYPALNEKPQAKYVLEYCESAPCQLTSGVMIKEALHTVLNVAENEATEDGLFLYKGVACVGACQQDPFIKIKDHIFPNLTPAKIDQLVMDLKAGHFEGIL